MSSLSDAMNLISTLKAHAFLGNLKHSSLYNSLTSLEKTKLWSRFYVDEYEANPDVLDVLSSDQKIITNPCLSHKRRTAVLKRNRNEAFGFTVQTYIVKRNVEAAPMKISYIDYVHFEGPAANAGIRPGDVIISINGLMVTEMSHSELIALISSCQEMRMILIFENIRERVQLIARAIRLRKLLSDKLYQLNCIDIQEQNILNRGLARALAARRNTAMNNSLCSCGSLSLSSQAASDSLLCGSNDSMNLEMKTSYSNGADSKGSAISDICAPLTLPFTPNGEPFDAKDSVSTLSLSLENDCYPKITRL